ncbi:MAG: hypothetical protein H0V71_03615 [Chloroflexi bacterium]|nr:hypothetical protein [Chloroflexota bacterium]
MSRPVYAADEFSTEAVGRFRGAVVAVPEFIVRDGTGVLVIPALERLRRSAKFGLCEACGAKWRPSNGDSPAPLLFMDHTEGCVDLAAMEEWLARIGRTLKDLTWEAGRIGSATDASG